MGILCSKGRGGAIGKVTGTTARIHTTTLHSPTRLPRDDGTSRTARRQARCVDQASVNSGQTDTRRQTPEGGGTGGRGEREGYKPTMSPQS